MKSTLLAAGNASHEWSLWRCVKRPFSRTLCGGRHTGQGEAMELDEAVQ